MNWKDKLTKKQKQHLAEQEIKTLVQFIHVRTEQKLLSPDKEICWDCREIERKLDLS